MKIITFTKNNQFQALLQFNDPTNAQQAKGVGLLSAEVHVKSTFLVLYEDDTFFLSVSLSTLLFFLSFSVFF